MRKNIVKWTAAFLIVMTTPVYASSIDGLENKIEENNTRMEEKQAEKKKLELQKTELNEEIEEVAVSILTLSDEVAGIQTSLETKNKEISEKQSEIDITEGRITALEEDIVIKEKDIELKDEELSEQKEQLSKRVRAAYISNPSQSMIITLMESASILDFFDRMFFIQRMTETDNKTIETINRLIGELETDKIELQKSKQDVENEKSKLINEKKDLTTKKNALTKEKQELNLKMNDMEVLEALKKSAYKQMSSQEQQVAQQIGDIMMENEALENEIQELIREAQRKAEEKRKREAEEARLKAEAEAKKNGTTATPAPDKTVPSTSGYLRPIPGRITSPYGNRIHPIFGYLKFHTGLDYAGPTNTSVKATRSGEVISARYYSGYGNAIIIDHGDGMSSLYAHLNSIEVSVGQNVSQGQRIGGVGSTGDSTGPHLHFEIRKNGQHVNPSNYVNN